MHHILYSSTWNTLSSVLYVGFAILVCFWLYIVAFIGVLVRYICEEGHQEAKEKRKLKMLPILWQVVQMFYQENIPPAKKKKKSSEGTQSEWFEITQYSFHSVGWLISNRCFVPSLTHSYANQANKQVYFQVQIGMHTYRKFSIRPVVFTLDDAIQLTRDDLSNRVIASLV